MNTKQERAAFEAWYQQHHGRWDMYERDASGEYADKQVQGAFNVWQARAALKSQTVIDDDHLSIVLDVYDNAMQKAFDGREFQNPCKPGTPEHKAWEKGSKEGKKKRDAGLPNPIALQSQDREDAEQVIDALDSGEWKLTRNLPVDFLTDAANVQQAWMVERNIAPFCDSEGERFWTGQTAIKALRRGQKAIEAARKGEGEHDAE